MQEQTRRCGLQNENTMLLTRRGFIGDGLEGSSRLKRRDLTLLNLFAFAGADEYLAFYDRRYL